MNMLEPQANRRRSFRAEVEGCAILHAPGGVAVRCRVADLGLGGVRLERAPLVDGVMPGVEVTIELECAGAGWVVQRGRVVRQHGGQLAIVFDQLAPEVEDLIEDEIMGAVEALKVPRVVVVDRADERRDRVVQLLRDGGCLPLAAATPLEAVALVERSRNHVRAVTVAGTLTQTQADELLRFLTEEHPAVEVLHLDSDDAPVHDLVARMRAR